MTPGLPFTRVHHYTPKPFLEPARPEMGRISEKMKIKTQTISIGKHRHTLLVGMCNGVTIWETVCYFHGDSAGKTSACNAGDLGSIPGLGRSPGEGKATHSSILAWRIPWTIRHGSQRAGHDWATLTFTWYFLKKLTIEFLNYQAAPSLGMYLRELKTYIHKNMLTDVHNNIIHNCPKIETNTHQLMNGKTQCDMTMQWNIIWQ